MPIKGKRNILKYVGDPSQLFGVKEYRIMGGRADNVRAVDIKNGSGLEFTVLPDRGLDIAYLTYKGVNFSYISKVGIVAPQYYNERGGEFLRSFYAGFLTTCGLRNVGSSDVDEGEELGVHGRIANIPAEETFAGVQWEEDVPVMKVRGSLREARVFAENLRLTREISVKYGENIVRIHDAVENSGFRDEPLMLLYHFNLGYPLLSEKSRFIAPSAGVLPRSEEAAKGIDSYMAFQQPTPGYKEQVFYHDLKADSRGRTFAALVNPELNLGAVIRFDKNQLARMTQWKMMGEAEYVLGIEPCNCHVEGRSKDRREGTLEFLKPGEIREFNLEIEVLEGSEAINAQLG